MQVDQDADIERSRLAYARANAASVNREVWQEIVKSYKISPASYDDRIKDAIRSVPKLVK